MTVINAGATTAHDVQDFVASVRRICDSTPTADAWSPTVPSDDRNPLLRKRLTDIGWFDLVGEVDGADFLGAAGVELGRALASVDVIDDLLGHGVALGPGVADGVELARYRTVGDIVWLCDIDGARLVEILEAEPSAHLDAQAISVVNTSPADEHQRIDSSALDAWIAGMTGYIAGVAAGALDLAAGHARDRIAFGKPLASIDAVAKKLADGATASEGLLMAAHRTPDEFILRQAGTAAKRITADSHQVLGALGFTLEYPLQRFSRRVEVLRLWTPSLVDALTRSRVDA